MLQAPILSGHSFLSTAVPQVRAARRRCLSAGLALLIAGSLLATPVQPLAHAESIPTPLSPASGTTTTVDNYPPLGIPEFTWTSVEGATLYRIQFSQDIGFTTIPYQATTPHTHYTPTTENFSDGTWYWRVRVESPAPAGDYSTPVSFTKQWASTGNAPALTSPTAGATLDFFDDPAFSWQPVMGAAYYRFQIASSPDGFNTPLYSIDTLAPAHQPVDKRANGTYYWRVVPVDPFGRTGTASQVRSFDVNYNEKPTLLEPADNSEPAFTPTFRWTAARGTQYYRLQYSTDPTFNTSVTQVDTPNTTYTPVGTLPNDVNYYWRVRVYSGLSVAEEWSQTWSFIKKWYTQTVLLTPPNLYQYTRDPLCSWTPVPGASHYRIQVDDNVGFGSPAWDDFTANPFHVRPDLDCGDSLLYWRVTPKDGSGYEGKPSLVSSFVCSSTAWAPNQIYPLHYYSPEDANLEYLQLLHPREDRVVAIPLFRWHRMFTSTQEPTTPLEAYRVEVDDDPLFGSPDWTFDTENLSAVPTAGDPFTPTAGSDYYWHVRPLDGLGGSEIGEWSQRWKTHIYTTQGLTPTTGSVPTLLRPAPASELVEDTPLLEWWPLQGADAYEVQISTDGTDFASYITDTATVPYPAYAPQTRLDYYGTYYWRVRGLSGGSPVGSWSDPWRFQMAAQSHWQETRTLGNHNSDQLLIGSDPAGDATDNYDLSTLYVAQDADDWFFGFKAITATTDMAYALYLDLDHEDGSGATSDARGYSVTTISAHRPEYAIYVRQSGGSFDAHDVIVYGWTGSSWGTPDYLDSIGGALYYTSTLNYLEIQVPNTAIGMEDRTGSAAVSLFSVRTSDDNVQDSVPSDPSTTTLSRFASVSERLNLALPPNDATGDPTVFPSVQPFFWHKPVDASWGGYRLEVALDEEFTSWIRQYTVSGHPSVPPHYVDHTYRDLNGDNTYYWRVRPVYYTSGHLGAWSQPARFERRGFVADNLQTSVSFATPTFSWDMTEGAAFYEVQVDDDPGFGSLAVGANTTQNSYTPIGTLEKGTYYWRVRVNRYGGIINDWTYTQTFTLDLPRPTGLSHDPPGVAGRAPTLCWTPLVTPTGSPILAAWKYRVEVSKGDPTFSSIYDSAYTEQACWTPTMGYDDNAAYYWRVAMLDGQGKLGDYSEPVTFTKQYPVTTLISPTSGSKMAEMPTFAWTPVDGAASYRLEVSKLANFSALYELVTTNNTRYKPSWVYDIGETYYWRVAIIDIHGKWGPFNTAILIFDPYPYSTYLPIVIRS